MVVNATPFVIDVAGFRVGFRGAGDDLARARARYGAFQSDAAADLVLDLEAGQGATLDHALRPLFAKTFLARGALFVHASAVVLSGRAWVFPGPSGAGKSTLANTLLGDALCDEAVVLSRSDRQVFVSSTPYWRAKPRRAPVAGILFPRRSQRSVWRPLGPGRAMARLSTQVGPLSPEDLPAALVWAQAITKDLECAEIELASIDDIRRWLQPRLSRVS
jgi:hypothetical protein